MYFVVVTQTSLGSRIPLHHTWHTYFSTYYTILVRTIYLITPMYFCVGYPLISSLVLAVHLLVKQCVMWLLYILVKMYIVVTFFVAKW
jgi:hypothetical protein